MKLYLNTEKTFGKLTYLDKTLYESKKEGDRTTYELGSQKLKGKIFVTINRSAKDFDYQTEIDLENLVAEYVIRETGGTKTELYLELKASDIALAKEGGQKNNKSIELVS